MQLIQRHVDRWIDMPLMYFVCYSNLHSATHYNLVHRTVCILTCNYRVVCLYYSAFYAGKTTWTKGYTDSSHNCIIICAFFSWRMVSLGRLSALFQRLSSSLYETILRFIYETLSSLCLQPKQQLAVCVPWSFTFWLAG